MHICTLDLDAYFNICITHFHTVRGVPYHTVVPNGAMPNSIQILNTFSVNLEKLKPNKVSLKSQIRKYI